MQRFRHLIEPCNDVVLFSSPTPPPIRVTNTNSGGRPRWKWVQVASSASQDDLDVEEPLTTKSRNAIVTKDQLRRRKKRSRRNSSYSINSSGHSRRKFRFQSSGRRDSSKSVRHSSSLPTPLSSPHDHLSTIPEEVHLFNGDLVYPRYSTQPQPVRYITHSAPPSYAPPLEPILFAPLHSTADVSTSRFRERPGSLPANRNRTRNKRWTFNNGGDDGAVITSSSSNPATKLKSYFSVPSSPRWRHARKPKPASKTQALVGWLLWQITSCGHAVGECGLAAGRRLYASGARVWKSTKKACCILAGMADNKFTVVKKSISSWSLSTINKPKLKKPKFSKPKIKIFPTKKKNRAEEEKKTSAETTPEQNEPLIHTGISKSKTVIHKPNDEEGSSDQPYIILTVPDSKNLNKDYNDSYGADKETENNQGKSVTESRDTNDENEFSKSVVADEVNREDQEDQSFQDDYEAVNKSSSKSSPESENKVDPGTTTDDLSDDSDDGDVDTLKRDGNHASTCAGNLDISPEEYYAWFDAEGGTLKREGDQRKDEDMEDYANYLASEYYDANDSRTMTPSSGKSYEDVAFPSENVRAQGSVKAREWVKNFNCDPEDDDHTSISCNLPRSQSEVQLSKTREKRNKDEIILNADKVPNSGGNRNMFSKLLSKANKTFSKDYPKEAKAVSNAQEEIERKESIKKLFGVRGKLSSKFPIIDSKLSSYKDEDIQLASAPYALTSIKGIENSDCMPCDSLESIEDSGANKPNHVSKPDKYVENDAEQLMKDIESYLGVTDQMGDERTLSQGSRGDDGLNVHSVSESDGEGSRSIESKASKEETIDLKGDDNGSMDRQINTDAQVHDTNVQDSFSDEGVCENKIDLDTQPKELAFLRENEVDGMKINQLERDAPNNDSQEVENQDLNVNSKSNKMSSKNITNTLKTIKNNIFSDNMEKIKLREEWKKRKTKFNNFRHKIRNRRNGNIAQTDDNFLDETVESIDFENLEKDSNGTADSSLANLNDSLRDSQIKPDEVRKEVDDGPSFHSKSELSEPIGNSDETSSSNQHSQHDEECVLSSPADENDGASSSPVADQETIESPVQHNETSENDSYCDLNSSKKGNDENEDSPNESSDSVLMEKYANIDVKTKKLLIIKNKNNEDKSLLAQRECNADSNDEEPLSERYENVCVSPEINVSEFDEVRTSTVEKVPKLEEDNCRSSFTGSDSSNPIDNLLYQNEIFDDAGNENIHNKLEGYSSPTPKEPSCPKPNPRTKKGKYGYAKLGGSTNSVKSPCEDKSSKLSISREDQKGGSTVVQSQEIPNDALRQKFNSKEFGYGDNYTDGSSGISEPIYWEIGDSTTIPRANPRKKKEKSSRSTVDVNGPHLSNANVNFSSNTDFQNSSDLPEWIQQRPPIPSPRNKKPKSSQSIQESNSSSKSEVNSPQNLNPFTDSFNNVHFEGPKVRNESKWSGEDFYSGRAASIAYGVTTHVKDPQPAIPQRSKKASLTSLPGSVALEDPVQAVKKVHIESQPKTSSGLSEKRNRRRTSPVIPPKVAPRHHQKVVMNPMQALKNNLRYLMEITTSLHGGSTHPEVCLGDALYSINSVMGQETGSTWTIMAAADDAKGTHVTVGQIKSHLQEAFQVSPTKFEEIQSQVVKRDAANITLTLKILEASDLRPKTVRGGSNPFVTVSIPGTTQGHRTRTEYETLFPKWEQEFQLKVKNLNKDAMKLDVWHSFDPSVSSQVSAVKDLKGVSRLVKGTTAVAQRQDAHLLGSVQVALKNVREKGINAWYPLTKEVQKEEGKVRGSLHIEAFVTAAAQGLTSAEARLSHDALLARLVYHHVKTISNNNTEEEVFQVPWHGKLSPESSAAVAQHAIVLGLTPALQNLSWWIVGSRVPSADAGWQLQQLKLVQKNLSAGLYDVSDVEAFGDSLVFWIDYSLLKLRNLKKSFPPTSGIIAKHQLSSMLSTFICLESHTGSSQILERRGITDLQGRVREAATDYTKAWWTQLIEENLKMEVVPEVQIQKINIITSEAFHFLNEIALFYSPSLYSEMDIPYFREMYLLITKKLNPCVRPPLMNVYSHLDEVSTVIQEDQNETKVSTITLEDGTNLWQLYMNLGKLSKLGIELPEDIKKNSGIYEYHKWFNRGVRRWVELARAKAELMIEKAVKLDSFEPIDEYNNFSSSATDVSGIFTDVQIWWQKLEWPDPENSMILLAKILEDICSYGMKYADLLKHKVEEMFILQTNKDQLVISKQICTGLNNIDRIRDEITRLPVRFGVENLIRNVKYSKSGGEEASSRFQSNIDTLIESSSENMEGKVMEFIEAVIEKMTGTLHHAVIQACEASSEKPLLIEVLDPALQLLHKKMSDNNFKRFIQRMWEVLIEIFLNTVTRNTDKRKASYFNGVYGILNSSVDFFSPCDGVGISKEEAKTQEFLQLIGLLECLRLSSENLISKYYAQRHEEQKIHSGKTFGELVVRAFFTKAGKLLVEVIMAKDMQLNNDTISMVSKSGQFGSSQGQIKDSYVKVQLMPSEWFPTLHEVRTKTMKSDPAVFEENFEFDLKNDDNGVMSGYLLFTLKDYHLGRSNKFIGESVIPLSELECVDSSCTHCVSNTYLKITQPGIEGGYSSLRALRLRSSDKVATSFLKKVQSRLPEVRHRGGVGGGALSSDEEKPRAKSPRLLQRIGLS